MTPPRYAESTSVPSDRSIAEIDRTLARYGADAFAYSRGQGRAAIEFVMEGRRVRFMLPLPDPTDREFTQTPTGRTRTASATEEAYEQAVRQRWRALALMVKAKLEAVAAGIVTFEVEFLPHTLMPSGRTVAQEVLPAVQHAYETGAVTPLQIGPSS